jgi:excisionase family DNA binding protein
MTAQRPLLLTRREACERLRLSPRTIANLIEQGDLPVVRIGRAVRFSVEDLEALVAERRVAREKRRGRAAGPAPRSTDLPMADRKAGAAR